MKKILDENQLRQVISNKIATLLREADFNPTQEDWDNVMFNDSAEEPALENDEIGAAHDAEFARAEEWWKSLNASNKYDVMTEAGDYDAFIDGLNEWYGYMGAEHLSPEEMEEYLDDCWDYAPQDNKMQMYQDFKNVFSNKNINENKKNMAKKTINEAMLRQIIAKNVARVLREELEMGAPEMKDEGGIDMAAVIEQVKQYALDDDMTVPVKKEKIESGEYDEAIRTWAERTMAKGEREGHPYTTTEECVEHMVNGSSYMRFFYPAGMGGSHHTGEKSRMKNAEPAGLAEAITKNVLKALKNL